MSVKIIMLRDPNRIQAAEFQSLCPRVKRLESRLVGSLATLGLGESVE
jgi:hypothetical protein